MEDPTIPRTNLDQFRRQRREAPQSVGIPIRARVGRLVAVALTVLLVNGHIGWGEKARADGIAPQADDWFTINKDYLGQRYVDLDQITPNNVANLKEVCEVQLNEPVMFNTGLLKVGRTLYVTTANQTVAFDAATCDLRWQYVSAHAAGGGNSRGAGYSDGKIFRGTLDGRVIALDAKTGQLLWQTQGANPANNEFFVAAPIAWQGKVFIGIIVSDFGIAGRLMAFDANTGKELWRFQTTLPGPDGQPAPSGGGFWDTFSLDPTTGEVFGPVANPYPDFNRDLVIGDQDYTKYTDSVISVDANTGRLNWSYQVVPGDEHDWDMAAAPTLYPTIERGNGRSLVALAGKSGRVYAIDRGTHLLTFDMPATTLDNDQKPLINSWMHVCPGINGGAQFNGAAYHPGLGTLYVGMVDFCSWYIKGANYGSAMFGGLGGAQVKDWPSAAKLEAPRGWITAIDGKSGRVQWQYQAESQVQAGLVPTKSGLLFTGDTHGNLLVLNAKDGSELIKIDAGGALNNGLISYAVGGQQYVAAAVGGATENPSTVAGPLRVSVYGLNGSSEPKVVTLNRLQLPPASGKTAGQALFGAVCAQCHLPTGAGGSSPPILRQSQLSDPELLKQFLMTVPPPMPHLYPGVLQEKDVEMIAQYLKTGIFNCGPNEPQSCQPPAQPMSGGTAAWKAVYSVLTSPRCINCHPVASPNLPHFPTTVDNSGYEQDYPRQGDDRHPHYYGVLRGDVFDFKTAEGTGTVQPGKGPPFEQCTFCHGTQNDPVTGIPGTTNPELNPGQPFWYLAPASMAWESAPGVPLNGAQLCANLLNKQLNGNRDPRDLLHHLQTEPLVKWSFNPGIGQNGEPRTTPPISHDALIQAFKQWIAEGTPCPRS
jgi:alcohol dehydrogenase (cytochrome c)